ncbi:hypothetical protein D3C73_1525110 [compost metagenome]
MTLSPEVLNFKVDTIPAYEWVADSIRLAPPLVDQSTTALAEGPGFQKGLEIAIPPPVAAAI